MRDRLSDVPICQPQLPQPLSRRKAQKLRQLAFVHRGGFGILAEESQRRSIDPQGLRREHAREELVIPYYTPLGGVLGIRARIRCLCAIYLCGLDFWSERPTQEIFHGRASVRSWSRDPGTEICGPM